MWQDSKTSISGCRGRSLGGDSWARGGGVMAHVTSPGAQQQGDPIHQYPQMPTKHLLSLYIVVSTSGHHRNSPAAREMLGAWQSTACSLFLTERLLLSTLHGLLLWSETESIGFESLIAGNFCRLIFFKIVWGPGAPRWLRCLSVGLWLES